MDANCATTEVEQYFADYHIKAKVVTPSNTETMCFQITGSLIDFAIVSDTLLPYVKSLKADPKVPWGPHVALVMEIKLDFDGVLVRKLAKPRKFCPSDEFSHQDKVQAWEQTKLQLFDDTLTELYSDFAQHLERWHIMRCKLTSEDVLPRAGPRATARLSGRRGVGNSLNATARSHSLHTVL